MLGLVGTWRSRAAALAAGLFSKRLVQHISWIEYQEITMATAGQQSRPARHYLYNHKIPNAIATAARATRLRKRVRNWERCTPAAIQVAPFIA